MGTERQVRRGVGARLHRRGVKILQMLSVATSKKRVRMDGQNDATSKRWMATRDMA